MLHPIVTSLYMNVALMKGLMTGGGTIVGQPASMLLRRSK